MLKKRYKLAEAARLLDWAYNYAARKARAGEIPIIVEGEGRSRRLYVPGDWLEGKLAAPESAVKL